MRPNSLAKDELSELKKLRSTSNWSRFVEDIKDLALCAGIWDYLKQDFYTEMRRLGAEGQLSSAEVVKEMRLNGQALGLLRKNISNEYKEMIKGHDNAFEAFRILEQHFQKTEAGDQNELTKEFLALQYSSEKGMDFYIQEHSRLKAELSECGMGMTDKQARAAFVDGLTTPPRISAGKT